jgi:hypothetical protein
MFSTLLFPLPFPPTQTPKQKSSPLQKESKGKKSPLLGRTIEDDTKGQSKNKEEEEGKGGGDVSYSV